MHNCQKFFIQLQKREKNDIDSVVKVDTSYYRERIIFNVIINRRLRRTWTLSLHEQPAVLVILVPKGTNPSVLIIAIAVSALHQHKPIHGPGGFGHKSNLCYYPKLPWLKYYRARSYIPLPMVAASCLQSSTKSWIIHNASIQRY